MGLFPRALSGSAGTGRLPSAAATCCLLLSGPSQATLCSVLICYMEGGRHPDSLKLKGSWDTGSSVLKPGESYTNQNWLAG